MVTYIGVLVLGIDGLGFEGLRALGKYGLFRSLNYLLDRGATAPVKTCFPPQTIPAWISLFTGVNPGKHGVFSFLRHENRKHRLCSALDVKFPPVYELLSMLGHKVALINIPLSYPFPVLNGVGIPDWLAPSKKIFIRRVGRFRNIIADITSDYIFPRISRYRKIITYSESIVSGIEARRWVVEGLMELEFIDHYFIVLSELDWIFHRYYDRVINGSIPRRLFDILKAFDGMISGLIRRSIKRNMNIFVVSDHGFHTYDKIICVNDLLKKLGYASGISVRRVSEAKRGNIRMVDPSINMRIGFRMLPPLLSITYSTKLMHAFSMRIYKYMMRSGLRLFVDTEKSRAFALLNIPAFFIAINKKIKPNHKSLLIQDIINKLSRLSIDNTRLFSMVKRREDVYHGPYTHLAPHICIFGNINHGFLTSPIVTGRCIIERKTNYHDFQAIFIAYGDDIPRYRLEKIKIYDISPTILGTLGIPIQKGLDGSSLLRDTSMHDYMKTWCIARRLTSSPQFHCGES